MSRLLEESGVSDKISWGEFEHHERCKSRQQLELRLLYGMYEIVTSLGDEEELLEQLTGEHLYTRMF